LAWESWARVALGERAALASSWDRLGGHIDANQYESPPGLILGDLGVVAATLRGPGIIERLWMPHFTATQPFAIRMYFDGETVPRIASDSGQLLGGTFGYFAAPLVSTFAGGQVCYEPIVFRDSLRIETENRSGRWHWYQYSVRRLAAGADVTSYTGALDASAQSARLAVASMFQNVGQHPAGESATSSWSSLGATSVPAQGDVTIADLAGPGLIRRLCVRMDGAADADLDSLHLRIFYDGDAQPAVDAPVGWFFGAGHGRVPYKSLPMGTDSSDGFYCYWPMPFHQAVRVELSNLRSTSVEVDGAAVEYEAQPVANDAGYLHAAAKSVFRTGTQWNVLAVAEGTGHYVGNMLFVEQPANSQAFLEGDDLVIVDHADSLHGTGMEDAYNGGFYYNWVDPPMVEPEGPSPSSAIRPLSGILRVQMTTTPSFACAEQYRWMIADRVPFSQSLEVKVESQYAWTASRWTSVVFWYQLPPIVSDASHSTGVAVRPVELALRPSEPNPVQSAALLRFSLPADAATTLDLLDVRGRKVRTLLEGRYAAGPHELRWSRGSLPSGVYFLRLRAGGEIETRKLILVR
jgi:hypothetical protein